MSENYFKVNGKTYELENFRSGMISTSMKNKVQESIFKHFDNNFPEDHLSDGILDKKETTNMFNFFQELAAEEIGSSNEEISKKEATKFFNNIGLKINEEESLNILTDFLDIFTTKKK